MIKKEVEQLKRWLRRMRLSCARKQEKSEPFCQSGNIAFGMRSAFNFALEKISQIENKSKGLQK